MHFTAFENIYLLQAIGWAIINSLWQAGFLWLIYILIVSFNKKTPAVFKYNLSLFFLFGSFIWFVVTIVETSIVLKNSSVVTGSIRGSLQFINFQQLNNLLPWLSFFYIAAFCFYIIKFINSYQKISSLQKSKLLKAPLDLRMFTKTTAWHIGIKKDVQVWLSEQVDVPSVISFIKPIILLPIAVISHLTKEQLEAILLHELAHIKRNDYLINLLQSVIEIFLFFNPFAGMLSSYSKKERENCCDDWVLNYQYNKQQYAGALLILEEQRRKQLLLAMAATNKKEILLNRIKRIFYTEPQTNFSFIQKLKMSVICILLFFGIAFLFPFTNNKKISSDTYIDKINTSIKNQPLAIVFPVSNKEAVVFNSNIQLFNIPVTIKRKTNKKQLIKDDNDYTIALINNDLIKENRQPRAITTNEDEIPDTSYYVKIEEEQSGKKQMNVYYFRLNKDKGNTDIKPLLLLSKPVRIKNDSYLDSTVSLNKRITL